jgi:phosphoglycolate phosphatase-like HAD superfamily hydrolase
VLGANQPPSVAAQLANIAATITVRKLRTTGTATPEEILAVGPEPDYIFEAELAEAPHLARYLEGTEIELIGDLPGNLQIEHCIFDHDGTLSTLREGWEKIMEPMMVREILGPIYATAAASLFVETTEKVRRFIDRTTGIQTLVQMKGLVDLVSQAGYVGKNEILDEHEYKQIFNRELMQMVQRRIDRLGCGELDSTDFQIKNARALLEELHKRGVKLYLASGTDEEEVIAEAKAMGYADLFEGRIFGAVGDIKTEAKRMVLERIMRDYTLAGHQFATFGDGPVEIRETRKRGGFCIGVASDELRRFGWNLVKRTRLIRAGASVVVPDYSQLTALLKVLNFA